MPEKAGRAVVAILAPRGRDATVARDLLTKDGIGSIIADSMVDLAQLLLDDLGCVLLTEENLTGPGLDDLHAALAAQPIWSDLPFVVLTNGAPIVRSAVGRARIDLLRNAILLARPLHADTLLRAVHSALDARSRQFDARARMQELHLRETELRESESKFHDITDFIDQMVWTTRPDGYHDYYNRRWYEFTGMPEGSTDGEEWNGVFHPDDQSRSWKLWRHSLATGEPYEIEYRLRHHSGEYRWVLGRAKAVYDDNGKIRRWYGTCTDIHDEYLARDETLALSRKERDLLWNGASDLFVIISDEGFYRAVNPRWTAILGYERAELIGARFDALVHQDDMLMVHEAFTEIIGGTPAVNLPLRIIHRDGTYRFIEWNVGKQGDSLFGSGRDITERIEREAALAASEAALRQSQKLETIGQLTGGVAHDFNNLLMATRSSLELLQSHLLPGDTRAVELLANADQATARGARLTQRMLAFARKQELNTAAVDVTALLPSLKDLISRSVGPQIEIQLALTPNVPPALVDVNQLEMAVLNLAVNARDAMSGSGQLTIALAFVTMEGQRAKALGMVPGNYIRLSVKDTGAGMDAATLARATEPFFTTKAVGEGTGLGLSMVHGLAAQSGGMFHMESTPGQGTMAILYLPAADTEDVARAQLVPAMAASSPEGVTPKALTILAVDDDILVLLGTVGLLEDAGHKVLEASSGKHAVDVFETHPEIDLVITDHAMPKMTGVQLAAILRARRPDIPIILASGYADMPEGAGTNIAARLEKPFGAVDLNQVIETVSKTYID